MELLWLWGGWAVASSTLSSGEFSNNSCTGGAGKVLIRIRLGRGGRRDGKMERIFMNPGVCWPGLRQKWAWQREQFSLHYIFAFIIWWLKSKWWRTKTHSCCWAIYPNVAFQRRGMGMRNKASHLMIRSLNYGLWQPRQFHMNVSRI